MKRALATALIALAVMGCNRPGEGGDQNGHEVGSRTRQEQVEARPAAANGAEASATGGNVAVEENIVSAEENTIDDGNAVDNANGSNNGADNAANPATPKAPALGNALAPLQSGPGALQWILVGMVLGAALLFFGKRELERARRTWARRSDTGSPEALETDPRQRSIVRPAAAGEGGEKESGGDPELAQIIAALSEIGNALREERTARETRSEPPNLPDLSDWPEIAATIRQTAAIASTLEGVDGRLAAIEAQLEQLRPNEGATKRRRWLDSEKEEDETPPPPTPALPGPATPPGLHDWIAELLDEFNAVASRYDNGKASAFIARYKPQFVACEGKATYSARRSRSELPLLVLSMADQGLFAIRPQSEPDIFLVLPSMTASRDWKRFYINNSGATARTKLGDCFDLRQGEHLAVEAAAWGATEGNGFKLEQRGILLGLREY